MLKLRTFPPTQGVLLTWLLSGFLFLVTCSIACQAAVPDSSIGKVPPAASEVGSKEQSRVTIEEMNQLKEQMWEQQKVIEELRAKLIQHQSLIEYLQTQHDDKTTETADSKALQVESSSVASRAERLTTSAEPRVLAVSPHFPQSQSQGVGPKTDEKPVPNALSINGFRFSGDFRFRLDVAERSASPLIDAFHNVRGRYRLRVNTDKEVNSRLNFHLQLSTGPFNNGLTNDQDFTSIVLKHPFNIAEAYMDFHPSQNFSIRGGRMEEIFADNSRFLFDDDVRFNGFAERWRFPYNSKKFQSMEVRAGQYNFTNPVIAIISPGSPLASAGQVVGTQARSSQLFHQGLVLKTAFQPNLVQNWVLDLQLYRNPNQLALALTPSGFPVVASPGLGVALSGPLTGQGNALTGPGGAMFTARHFQILHLAHEIQTRGVQWRGREMPLTLGLHVSRNFGTSQLRDAILASVNLGKIENRGDLRALYAFAIKDANSMISQLTDDDLATGTGVNIRTHHVRLDLGLAKGIALQNLFFFQTSRRSNNPADLLFVPVPRGASPLFRYLGQLEIKF